MACASRSVGARSVVVLVAAALVVLPACTDANVPSGIDPIASASPIVTVPPTIGPVGCDPASPSTVLDQGLEVEGTIEGGRDELWALFTGDGELVAGLPIAVYWRIGGDKGLQITLVGPNDRIAGAQDSPYPQPHPEWERPGEPWVSEITFPQPGCWRVYVERARRVGDLWVTVG